MFDLVVAECHSQHMIHQQILQYCMWLLYIILYNAQGVTLNNYFVQRYSSQVDFSLNLVQQATYIFFKECQVFNLKL